MNGQSKQDVVACAAVLLMFIGAFILPSSSLGLFLIASGAIVVLFLVLKVLCKEK
jgi:hypothetical protein